MKRLQLRRPSPALVISVLALFVAMGGTVYAASKINGKAIKAGSIPGNRLKKHSLTGKQIDLSKLGTVPSATSAVNASNATNASRAVNALDAANAASAANLNGMTRFRTTIAAGGTSEATANSTTLYTDGPLSLVGKCWLEGTEILGNAYLRTTVPAFWTAYDQPESGGPLSPGVDKPAFEEKVEATPPEEVLADPFDGTFAALTADRSAYFTGLGSVGANIGGSGGCTFAGWAMSS
jgi:hypothetical protein